MPTYRGTIRRVGATGGNPAATTGSTVPALRGKLSVLEIGETELRNVSCSHELYDVLVPGREAELYVQTFLFRGPCIIGVEYVDGDGGKYATSFGEFLAVLSSYLLLYPSIVIVLGVKGGLLLSLAVGHEAALGWSALVVAAALGWSAVKGLLLVRKYLVFAVM